MPRRFVIIVLVLLTLLHVYIGLRLIPDMALVGGEVVLAVALLCLSVLLVPAGLLSSRIHNAYWSDRLAWIGLLATGFFSSLLVFTLLREAGLLVLLLFPDLFPRFAYLSAYAVPGAAVAVTLLGYINARRVAKVVHVQIPLENLPPQLDGYSIAQISDIHVGPTIKRGYLNAVVNRVNALKANAIAVTGDLVDGPVERLRLHTEPLARLQAPDGVFFVTGNHEYYSGVEGWIAELRRLGLKVLLNQHVVRHHDGADIVIAGVTDYMAHQFSEAHRSDPMAAVAGTPPGAVKLLLAHQPRSAEAAAAAGFDVQLSGHTHGGQFFPWNLFVPLQQPFVAGLNRIGRLWVYTSRGTGYWGPPKRFLAPSEITLVRLVRAMG
jgi:hypothetical protein